MATIRVIASTDETLVYEVTGAYPPHPNAKVEFEQAVEQVKNLHSWGYRVFEEPANPFTKLVMFRKSA